MKKLAATLLTTAALTSALMAAEGMSFYGGGGLAIEAVPDSFDKNDNATLSMGTAIVLRGGMNLPMLLEGFGAEVELTKSVINPEYEYTYTDYDYSGYLPVSSTRTEKHDISIMTFAAYAVYTIPLGDKFYVKPRFGIILPNLGDEKSANSRDITFSSGIGGGFKVMEQMNIYVDYTVIGEFVTNYGAGVEYHF